MAMPAEDEAELLAALEDAVCGEAQDPGTRRLSLEAELKGWSDMFTAASISGRLRRADMTGLVDPVHVWPIEARPAAAAAWNAAARDAWHRLGGAYLEVRPDGGRWAVEAFGAPPCR